MNSTSSSNQPFYSILKQLYAEQLPFNRLLGITDALVDTDGGRMTIGMREDLVGNIYQQTLHGGVISGVLDAVGGLTASASLADRAAQLTATDIQTLLSRVGTIDLRVDYLRPGRGQAFAAQGRIMRAGRKVAVVRMEMHNDSDLLVAVGTGTYMIG